MLLFRFPTRDHAHIPQKLSAILDVIQSVVAKETCIPRTDKYRFLEVGGPG